MPHVRQEHNPRSEDNDQLWFSSYSSLQSHFFLIKKIKLQTSQPAFSCLFPEQLTKRRQDEKVNTSHGISFLSLLYTKCQSYCTLDSLLKKEIAFQSTLERRPWSVYTAKYNKNVFCICCLNFSCLELQLLKRKFTLYISGRVVANLSVSGQSWRRTEVYTHEMRNPFSSLKLLLGRNCHF